jgi:predicted transcriptional regulator
LLAADAGRSDEEIARSVAVSGSTVYRTKRRFVECAIRRSRPEIPREGGRLYRLKPARDSDDPGRDAGQALVSTSSSGQLAGSSSSF